MAEAIGRWWERRRFSRGLDVPYPVGTYREAWASFPVLVLQYRPEYNGGIVLSQIPPAADVYLCWLCDAGHVFVATPEEQRHRPGRERRRSSWCPDCAALAKPRTPRPAAEPVIERPSAPVSESAAARSPRPARTPTRSRPPRICSKTPQLPPGEPFVSACAPPPASAVEARLRALLAERLEFEPGFTAVRLGRPFFEHLEAWPDIVLSELRVAIEYDSTGRHGLEHVGHREEADRRKDRALRAVGWEVVRVRTGRLPPLGPHDVLASGVSAGLVDRLLDELREIRGSLLVDAWTR
ncbi:MULTISPECIES: hypothetical protein [unclassified Rathayibacter]|uniref:hypothetical protein n=1 Tax=unclassified Rathayibacter TaxID=2609250 RepID=UPI0010E33BA3|nr:MULTISPECIES: hypothetical protein [unclassified Rathayibacter]MCJ1702505.1 hypothetical protein [Rathayibacter sp. VKM Ac-2926]TCL85685.1 hypothetical protein EDF49_101353 [Rathayibacter sp. PhB192]TCM31506.1 hypothetical protein EDF43_101353 [Rathayibacter sp. PhB179]